MKTIKKNVGFAICFAVLGFTLALGAFQLYRSTVNFASALRRAAEELERAFKNLQMEEQRLRDLETKKEKLSQVPIFDVSKTMHADELRELLVNFFEQDVIDVQEVSIRCEVSEPVVFENVIPTFVVTIRSGLTAASPEAQRISTQESRELGGQATGTAPSQVPPGVGGGQDSGGTSVGGQ